MSCPAPPPVFSMVIIESFRKEYEQEIANQSLCRIITTAL